MGTCEIGARVSGLQDLAPDTLSRWSREEKFSVEYRRLNKKHVDCLAF
jgi:hypothetical protein